MQGMLSIPLVGDYSNGTARGQGRVAGIWSSVYYNEGSMRLLVTNPMDINMQASRSRSNGRSIRCVLDERTLSDITTMQEVNSTIVANTAVGANKDLVDTRDNVTYKVGKLPDGRLWMLDNLDLDLNSSTVRSALNPANTNATAASLNALRNGGGDNTNGLAQRAWADGVSAWTNERVSYYALSNRTGTCDASLNTSQPCKTPVSGITDGYQGNPYTGSTVIDKYDPVTPAVHK